MKIIIASLLLVSTSAFAGSAHIVYGAGGHGGGLAIGTSDPDPKNPSSCHVDFVIPPEGGTAVSKLICGDFAY